MDKKEKKKLVFIYVLIFFSAILMDISKIDRESGFLVREEPEGEERSLDLILNADGILENYIYEVEIKPQKLTETEARNFIKMAKDEIDEKILLMDKEIPVEEVYGSELVETEWYFSPSGYVKNDGSIRFEELKEEKQLITASVTLKCSGYEEIYQFPIVIQKPKLSKEEEILEEIAKFLEAENEREGTETFVLPEEVAGVTVSWSKPKENLTLKIVFLEMVSFVLILVSQKKQRAKEEEQRNRRIELTYSEVVSQLVVLLEAGMTTRQAWSYIGKQFDNRKKTDERNDPVTEAIIHLNQKLKEGESERRAYQQFGDELGVFCYRRLMRTLTGNLEKGNTQLCTYLEEESRRAYEERVLLAKKLGEEASTKMLIPLMLMLVLVMAAVMMPAIIGFSL